MLPCMSLIFPLTTPIPAQNKRRTQTRVARELNVAISIANHPAHTLIDLKILRSTIDQPRLRLTTITIKAVRRLPDRRMMRAIVNGVEPCVLELTLKLIVNFDDHLFRKVATRDSRLVRDHNREPAIVVQDPDRFRSVRKQAKARRVIDVANLLGNGAVSINENCWTLHLMLTRLSHTNSLRFWRNCRASTMHASDRTLHRLLSPSCSDDRSGNHGACMGHTPADVSGPLHLARKDESSKD